MAAGCRHAETPRKTDAATDNLNRTFLDAHHLYSRE
jgi:hypothetical protein